MLLGTACTLVACMHADGLAQKEVNPICFACIHVASTCLLGLPAGLSLLAGSRRVVAVPCASTEDVASGAGARWRRRTSGTWPCPPPRRLRAPRRLAASCWAACERVHMRRCSSDTGHVARSQVACLNFKPYGLCPVGVHVRLDFFFPTLGKHGTLRSHTIEAPSAAWQALVVRTAHPL